MLADNKTCSLAWNLKDEGKRTRNMAEHATNVLIAHGYWYLLGLFGLKGILPLLIDL